MSKKQNLSFRSGGIVHFGERLREAMAGQSNLAFAKKCGLSETVIRGYLSGKTYPGVDKLPAIAEATGKSIEWLVTGEEKEEANEAARTTEELELWWNMILKSLTHNELASVIKAYQDNGKRALLDTVSANDTLGISRSAINTALVLEALPAEARREILSKYGINEQSDAVVPKTEPRTKAG